MIKELVTVEKINNPMKAEDLEALLDHCLTPLWRCCTPEELLRKSLDYFKLIMDDPCKGADNLQVPPFIVHSESVTLYISNRNTVCGKKQILYFFLEYIITGKIKNEKPLFYIDDYGSVIPCIQDPKRNYKMTENPGLNANAETLLSILNCRKK